MPDFDNLDEKISSAIERGKKMKEQSTQEPREIPPDQLSTQAPTTNLQGLEAKITSAIEKVRELKNQKESAENRANVLETELAGRNHAIEELKKQIQEGTAAQGAEMDKAIEELQGKLASVDSQVESLLKEVLDQ